MSDSLRGNSMFHYHEIAGPSARSRRGLPYPYRLAEPISRTLNSNPNNELELIQALDEDGSTHLLIHVTQYERQQIKLGPHSEVQRPEDEYQVLSPITFAPNVKKNLQKKMEKLEKQGIPTEAKEHGFFRCLYEDGRMYKRMIFDELTPQDCTKFRIPPTSIPIVSSTKVIAFSFIPWDSDWTPEARDTIVDFGIAYARVDVSQTEKNLVPIRENTIRIKNGDEVGHKLRRNIIDYPSNPTQTETLSALEIGSRLKDYFIRSVAENPVVLLVNDESRTKDILKKYGIDTQELGWKSGLKELLRSGVIESSRSRSRSPSRNRSGHPQRDRDYRPSSISRSRNRIHLVDIKGVYEKLSRTLLKPRDENESTRVMAEKMGLSMLNGSSAALNAEVLIQVFSKMINGTSIDEEHEVLQTLPPPPPPPDTRMTLQANSGVLDSDGPGLGDGDAESDEERDPNLIIQQDEAVGAVIRGGAGKAVEEDSSDFGADSDEEY